MSHGWFAGLARFVVRFRVLVAVAWGVVQGLAIWALIGAAIAVVIVAIRLVLAAG